MAPRSCCRSPAAGNSRVRHRQHSTAMPPSPVGARLGVIPVPPHGAGPQLLRAGFLGEGIFNCKMSLAGKCTLAAREVETRRTRLAWSGGHWQEVGRGDTLSGLQGDRGLTFWLLPLCSPSRSSGVQPHPGVQVWGSQVARAPQTGKSCSPAVIFGAFSLRAFYLCLSPLQRREPAESKSQECQFWECSIVSQPSLQPGKAREP